MGQSIHIYMQYAYTIYTYTTYIYVCRYIVHILYNVYIKKTYAVFVLYYFKSKKKKSMPNLFTFAYYHFFNALLYMYNV